MPLRRTADAVQVRATVPLPERTGAHDLLHTFNLKPLAAVAASSLVIDYTNPAAANKLDAFGKMKVPPAGKQLYWHPVQGERRDITEVVNQAIWPSHRPPYPFPQYPIEVIRTAVQLQPGPSVLPEHIQGVRVGPDRFEIAAALSRPAPSAQPSETLVDAGASQEVTQQGGRGRRGALGKRTRAAGSQQSHALQTSDSVGSGATVDTSVTGTASRRQRTS